MTKILATVGPISSGKNLKYLLDRCEIVRLNMSHNTIQGPLYRIMRHI